MEKESLRVIDCPHCGKPIAVQLSAQLENPGPDTFVAHISIKVREDMEMGSEE